VGVTAKDLALAIIGEIGTAGGTGYAIEFAGEAVRALSMEGRMTLCNMSIEAGARMGMVAVDDVTLDYVRGRPMAPRGSRLGAARRPGATCTAMMMRCLRPRGGSRRRDVVPQVTWGTSPEMVAPVTGACPSRMRSTAVRAARRRSARWTTWD
jgi:3-isopropylmalate/(R)-2-methylmalate dehydratase large subunit